MKKYIEAYEYFKRQIESGQIKNGDKMPSIRSASALLSLSKTTIQSAYFALQADGYIIATEKSGHYVSYTSLKRNEKKLIKSGNDTILYDLKSGGADKDSFDIRLWQRYIKNALRQQERLLTYSEVQGERDLREALSDYIREKRNIVASPDRIVIGAGVQCLLGILCSLVSEKGTVSFPDNSFRQGISLFNDYGFNVKTRYKDADIIYVCPSHMTSYGDVMPIKRRLELVKYSEQKNSLVIEDDYDNDFVYQSKPTPSLYALSNGGNVVYMGSFSNVLIPGIRISFMVLTKELSEKFEKYKYKFAQTASKTEQIALCGYIRDGHIKAQTRKVRRHYTSKAKLLLDEIKQRLPHLECELSENLLQVKIKAYFKQDTSIFNEKGILLHIKKHENNELELVLSPSAIEEIEIPKVVDILESVFQDS